jgi:hypothetical protein
MPACGNGRRVLAAGRPLVRPHKTNTARLVRILSDQVRTPAGSKSWTSRSSKRGRLSHRTWNAPILEPLHGNIAVLSSRFSDLQPGTPAFVLPHENQKISSVCLRCYGVTARNDRTQRMVKTEDVPAGGLAIQCKDCRTGSRLAVAAASPIRNDSPMSARSLASTEAKYRSLLKVTEHAPDGPTEEHLVEELARIIWRKRRLRIAEAALIREKLRHDVTAHNEDHIAAAALLPSTGVARDDADVPRAVAAAAIETVRELRSVKRDQGMTQRA